MPQNVQGILRIIKSLVAVGPKNFHLIYPVIEIASVDKKCIFIEHNNDKYIYFEIPVQNVKIEIEHWSGGHMNYDMQFTEGISFLLQYFFWTYEADFKKFIAIVD